MSKKITELFDRLDDLKTVEIGKFVPLEIDDIKQIGNAAVKIELNREEYWLPFSQLRHEDGELYASVWILDQKGIEV